MAVRRKPAILARKHPRQGRSQHLVEAIMQAAIRVLTREGARRFTTIRVAEQAGISVGSLYQYFPNKEAILFKLQTDEWAQTSRLLHAILADSTLVPLARLRKLMHVFFKSECEEAPFRVALADAAPMYRNAPEGDYFKSEHSKHFQSFVAEALPHADARQREFCADLLITTMGAVGEKISEEARSVHDIERFAAGVGDMLCAYFEKTERAAKRRRSAA